MDRVWILLGGVAGLTGVGMAAWAAHGLAGRLEPGALAAVRSAIEMQMWHAPALLFCGVWTARGSWLARLAGLGFAVGIVLFCGAIYADHLGWRHIPSMAPVGGVTLMAAWALLGLSALGAVAAPKKAR